MFNSTAISNSTVLKGGQRTDFGKLLPVFATLIGGTLLSAFIFTIYLISKNKCKKKPSKVRNEDLPGIIEIFSDEKSRSKSVRRKNRRIGRGTNKHSKLGKAGFYKGRSTGTQTSYLTHGRTNEWNLMDTTRSQSLDVQDYTKADMLRKQTIAADMLRKQTIYSRKKKLPSILVSPFALMEKPSVRRTSQHQNIYYVSADDTLLHRTSYIE